MSKRIFGHIPGYPEGTLFHSRDELHHAGVHRPLQAGISGSGKEGADSILLSGGYEDDEDYGDTIVYTGHGGRDPLSGQQVSDQLLERGNQALAYNALHGFPVRVIRSYKQDSPYSPPVGFRYEGLFRVEDYWRDEGKSGHAIWRFRLVKIAEPVAGVVREASEEYGAAERRETTVQRIVRDTAETRRIKALYNYRCQVCDERLEVSAGPYAEAAHIKPLGAPHNGPDIAANILCLCPNHHVLLDYGGFSIADDYSLLGIEGRLNVHKRHEIDREFLDYHRRHFYRAI